MDKKEQRKPVERDIRALKKSIDALLKEKTCGDSK